MDPHDELEATAAFRIIVSGKGSFSPRMWEGLIQARANRLRQEFDHFPLPTLGSLEYGGATGSGCSLEKSGATIIGNGGFTLRTRGIFGVDGIEYIKNFGPVVTKIWGFTEVGAWIIADIKRSALSHRHATEIRIQNTSLEKLIQELSDPPNEIWERLGGTVREWLQRTESRYRRAQRLARAHEMENHTLYAPKQP